MSDLPAQKSPFRRSHWYGFSVEGRILERSRRADNGCLIWLGSGTTDGYGKLSLVIDGKRHHLRAHRAMWEIKNGPIPKGYVVCHVCDNRRCIEPQHLFLGTQSDNIKDAVAKGRVISPFSPSHPRYYRGTANGDV